jgi:hypothetical protein
MDYQIFKVDEYVDIIEKYTQHVEKPTLIIKKTGIKNSNNEKNVEKALTHYKQILPIEVFTVFEKENTFAILFHSHDMARDFAEDYFPENDKVSYPELWVSVRGFDTKGAIFYANNI